MDLETFFCSDSMKMWKNVFYRNRLIDSYEDAWVAFLGVVEACGVDIVFPSMEKTQEWIDTGTLFPVILEQIPVDFAGQISCEPKLTDWRIMHLDNPDEMSFDEYYRFFDCNIRTYVDPDRITVLRDMRKGDGSMCEIFSVHFFSEINTLSTTQELMAKICRVSRDQKIVVRFFPFEPSPGARLHIKNFRTDLGEDGRGAARKAFPPLQFSLTTAIRYGAIFRPLQDICSYGRYRGRDIFSFMDLYIQPGQWDEESFVFIQWLMGGHALRPVPVLPLNSQVYTIIIRKLRPFFAAQTRLVATGLPQKTWDELYVMGNKLERDKRQFLLVMKQTEEKNKRGLRAFLPETVCLCPRQALPALIEYKDSFFLWNNEIARLRDFCVTENNR